MPQFRIRLAGRPVDRSPTVALIGVLTLLMLCSSCRSTGGPIGDPETAPVLRALDRRAALLRMASDPDVSGNPTQWEEAFGFANGDEGLTVLCLAGFLNACSAKRASLVSVLERTWVTEMLRRAHIRPSLPVSGPGLTEIPLGGCVIALSIPIAREQGLWPDEDVVQFELALSHPIEPGEFATYLENPHLLRDNLCLVSIGTSPLRDRGVMFTIGKCLGA